MMSRGFKSLVILSGLFFLFVIGFFLIEQRQSVLLVTRRDIRRVSQLTTLTENRLQEIMIERSKIFLPLFSSSLKVVPIGYRDVYRVELPSLNEEEKKVSQNEGIIQFCLDWILEKFPFAKMEI